MKLSGEDLLKRFKRAKEGRSNWEDMWQDIYDLVLPCREGFYATVGGEERTQEIYDETAPVALGEFNSKMINSMIPQNSQWAGFAPGTDFSGKQASKLQGSLDEISDFVFGAIGNSNFYNEAQELMTDIAIGWSTQIIDEGRDGALLNFKTIPQSHCYWDTGPFKMVDGVFRVREKVKISDLKVIWPKAIISDDLKGKMKGNPDAVTAVVEASYRDWKELGTEKYYYQVVAAADKSLVVDEEFTGLGSRPFVTPRWLVAAGETYGRGPLVQVLPAIRTVNLTAEMVLENAQMAIAGIWQLDDDGTINVNNVEIVPGAVYARPADSRGLERTDMSGAPFNVSDLVIATMQENIRKALFAENLGPVDQTPRSATEVAARMQNLGDQIGTPYSRLLYEWITPMLQRCVYLLTKAGKIEMPKVDGRQVAIVPKSPLARAQKFEEVERIRGFAADVIGIFGPQVALGYLDTDDIVEQLRANWEVRRESVRDEGEREQMMEQIGNALGGAQGEEQGGAPPSLSAVNG